MLYTLPLLETVGEPPVEPNLPPVGQPSVLSLTEKMLKDRDCIDDLLRDENRLTDLLPRFLMIGIASFSAYSWAMVLLLIAAPTDAIPSVLTEGWSNAVRPAVGLWLAYTVGLVAAIGVCMPSFYFYGLLAGVKTTFLQVVAHCLKGQAATAIMLIGILPIYVAVALGMLVFAAPATWQQQVLSIGLALPFIAGLWGVFSIYRGFMRLADTLPGRFREHRTSFLRRLTLAWSVCYTAVSPLMIHALWTLINPS